MSTSSGSRDHGRFDEQFSSPVVTLAMGAIARAGQRRPCITALVVR